MHNLHPVDELAQLRGERRRIEERIDALRAAILSGDSELEGRAHVARIIPTRAVTYTVKRRAGRMVRTRARPR